MNKWMMILAALVISLTSQAQIKVGTTVKTVTVKDADKNSKTVTSGGKPMVFYYIDPDASSVNDPLSEVMKSKKHNREKFNEIAVVNAKDTWIPTATIRTGVRKNNKPDGPLILIDESNVLSAAWGMGDCNNTCVLMIIDADNKIKFVKYIKSKSDSREAIDPFFAVLNAEMGNK